MKRLALIFVVALLMPALALANSHDGYSIVNVTPTTVAPGDSVTIELEYTVTISDGSSSTSLWAVILGGVTGQSPYDSAGDKLAEGTPTVNTGTITTPLSTTITLTGTNAIVVQIPETTVPGQYPLNIFSAAASGQTVAAFEWYVELGNGLPIQITVEQQDTTPPTITCPDDITVHVGTGETGAVVTYTVSATDDVTADTDIAIDCTPASGSLFPLGTTTVTCTAADEAGNQSSCSFTVTVLGPTELVDTLSDNVYALNLHHGIENSLDSKLDSALNALDDLNENNDGAAVNSLEAFINHTQAQSGDKIPVADADALMADAQVIIDLIQTE